MDEGVAPEAESPAAFEAGQPIEGLPGHDPQTLGSLRPTRVESVEDLPGEYYRPFALPGQLSWVSLGEMDLGTGEYEAYRSCGVSLCVPEKGTYHAVAENPAVGFAFLILDPAGSEVVDQYILDFLWRDADGNLVGVQMRRLLPGNVTGAPFVLFWIPRKENDEPVEANEPQASAATLEAPIDDLAGVYVRPAAIPGDIGALTLDEPAWQEGVATGSYQAAYPFCLPWCFPERGSYELDVLSPLFGTGVLRLQRGPEADDAHRYLVLSVWRNPLGDVVALRLQRAYENGILSPPFTMFRQWWTD